MDAVTALSQNRGTATPGQHSQKRAPPIPWTPPKLAKKKKKERKRGK
jgi:hypothetical protein